MHVRIDNRMRHGKVVQFWIPNLQISHLIIADDEVAANESLLTIYRMAVPEFVSIAITEVQRLGAELSASATQNTMVLLSDVYDAARAVMCGVAIDTLTLGNVHAAPGRTRVTDSVYLTPEETDALCRLTLDGIKVEIQTFPGEALRLVIDEGDAKWRKS